MDNMDGSSSLSSDSDTLGMKSHMIGLSEDILKEGVELEKEIVQEEKEKEAALLHQVEKSANQSASEQDIRFRRLMHLLDRSKFYANFLLQRMATKKEEEKIKQEKLAKREASKKSKALKENEATSVDEVEQKTVTGRTRGAKRNQQDISSPTADVSDTKLRKRSRKQNVSDANILAALDEEQIRLKGATQNSGDLDDDETLDDCDDALKPGAHLPQLFEGGTMRPYQVDGFKWLVSLYENGMNGILADEMGLGKTVQCIALIAHLMDKGVTGPFLVCAPLSTLPNWMSELKRFTPRIPTILYHGNQEKREEVQSEIRQKFKIPGINDVKFFPVVVTSFEVVIRDRKILERHQWRYIIVDEGHRLKNFQSRLVTELKKYPSSNRLLLTGTPLQNNLSELWSLLNFLLPEIFDDLDVFTAWFHVEEFQNSEAERKVVELERKESVLSMLHQILSPFLLRRLKTDVKLELPKKKELLVYCPMSKVQEELYRATVDRSIAFLLGLETKEEVIEVQANGRPKRKAKRENINYSAMGNAEETEELKRISAKKEDAEIDEWMKLSNDLQWEPRQPRKKTLQAVSSSVKMQNPMMQLRKIVNHPYLVKWEVDADTGEYVLNEDMIRDCGKLSVMDQMLKRLIVDGHKVLIFSQLTIMLDVLADYLSLREIKFCRLDGRMNLEERAVDMEQFRSDPETSVFLVSTRAGGLGVNLVAADTVIIYDSDWNPQCDLQAQDRCHRIGQTRPVIVYRLVTADTIDERIIDRASAKRKLEKLVIQKGKFKSGLQAVAGKGMSINEMIELLKTRDHSGEHRSFSGQVFSEDEMNALMDRSDLVDGEQPSNKEDTKLMQGVFRRLDVQIDELKN